MHYLGGKAKIAKKVVEVLNEYRRSGQLFVEPFCGGMNITCRMESPIVANDKNLELIELYKAMRRGWLPPDEVTEQEYQEAKNTDDPALKAFVGIGCSFAGKWFGGYAKNNQNRNYAMVAKNSLLKKFDSLAPQVWFRSVDYEEIRCKNALIYCDPPYANTTGYRFGRFDSERFWQWCRAKTLEGNTVVVSEYTAPWDFDIIASFNTKTDLHTKNGGAGGEKRIERLFTYNPSEKLILTP